ncbi:ADP-ribosylation factor [Mycena maculata]|uniref:ADP-ribosylation factor n=1 Tax=Mycena maculata TaxID=230809 RepID=A0AAD7JET8_9AGAR|nr:ADP-ribosylation factor [Mycena maculata]
MNLDPIRRLFDRIYPRPHNGYRIPMLGLDASGKTTILYRLKTGEIVTTVPTIGFNIENIRVRAADGRHITMLCWDAGGCDMFRFKPELLRPWIAGSDALIWILDSSDRERIVESIEELGSHISVIVAHSANPTRRDALPVLIVATKQDLPNVLSVDEIRDKVAKVADGAPNFVLGSTRDGGNFPEAFGWLLAQIEKIKSGQPAQSAPAPALPDPRSPAALQTKLDEWFMRAESDSSPEKFVRQFETLSLPAWDHYTHVRIAYLLLTIYGRQKGKNMIFDGIEKYIAESAQTRGRTFHVTMTYFWIQMVHYAIRSMPPAPTQSDVESISSMGTLVEREKQKTDEETPDDFPRFLLLNPFVADGNLWAEYYSKEVIMSPEAKAGMVLPDKKPLPNLVMREVIPSAAQGTKGSQ